MCYFCINYPYLRKKNKKYKERSYWLGYKFTIFAAVFPSINSMSTKCKCCLAILFIFNIVLFYFIIIL